MNCIILDDESVSREILTFLCNKQPGLNLKGSFANAIEAFRFLNNSEVDIIFLDIHMPGFTGFDFIQTLKNPPLVIITSSDKGQALHAFEYDSIIDFLSKPIDPERFEKSVTKASSLLKEGGSTKPKEKSAQEPDQFYINIDKKLIKLDLNQVYFFKAQGDYVQILLEKGEYLVHTTLSNVLDKLPNKDFFQVHRSYIINLSKIIDIQDNTVLIDKTVIPISRYKKSDLMKRINLF